MHRCRTEKYTCILGQVLWVYFRQSIQIKTTILTINEVVPSTVEVALSMVAVLLSMVEGATATTLTAEDIKSAAEEKAFAVNRMSMAAVTILH